jgi:pimeloyl-ACP methyl ester carboxylesterase
VVGQEPRELICTNGGLARAVGRGASRGLFTSPIGVQKGRISRLPVTAMEQFFRWAIIGWPVGDDRPLTETTRFCAPVRVRVMRDGVAPPDPLHPRGHDGMSVSLCRCVTHQADPNSGWTSPATYAKDITTPLLIIHSQKDYRCPIWQGEDLFIRLRAMKKEVEFVRFLDEGHEQSRSGSPIHRVMRFQVILDWLGRYLQPERGILAVGLS